MENYLFLRAIPAAFVLWAAGCTESSHFRPASEVNPAVTAPVALSTPSAADSTVIKPEWRGASLGPYFSVTEVEVTGLNRRLPVRLRDEVFIRAAKAGESGPLLALYAAIPPLLSPGSAPEPWLVHLRPGADKRVSEGKVFGLPVRVSCTVVGQSTVLPELPLLALTLEEYDPAGHIVGTQRLTLEPFLPKL